MKSSLAIAALAAAALIGLLAPAASADGDPASDYLLQVDVFYPYYSDTPKDELAQLQDTVRAAKTRGFPIKVAIITSPYDLGTVGVLWKKPQQYARFLSQELSFVFKGRLLIVMPNGFGYVERTRPVPAKLALVEKVRIGDGSTGLLESGDAAVRALAKSDGISLSGASRTTSGSGSSTTDIVVIVVAAAAFLALAAAVSYVLRRRRKVGKEQHAKSA